MKGTNLDLREKIKTREANRHHASFNAFYSLDAGVLLYILGYFLVKYFPSLYPDSLRSWIDLKLGLLILSAIFAIGIFQYLDRRFPINSRRYLFYDEV